MSGDADDSPTEEVAFYYNKIAFVYASTDKKGASMVANSMAWGNVCQSPWGEHNIATTDWLPIEPKQPFARKCIHACLRKRVHVCYDHFHLY